MDNIPFPPSKESKVRHMWRDIERRAELYCLPIPKVPAPYTLKKFDLAKKLYEKVIEIDPNIINAQFNLGIIYEELNEI